MAREYDKTIAGTMRAATFSYAFALLVIASLTIGTHLIIDRLVARQQQAAELISMSGRQRMLSQWIAKTSLQLATTEDSDARETIRAEMRNLIALMDRSHETLVERLKEFDPATPAGAALRRVYFGEPYRLDDQVRRYISLSNRILEMPPGVLSHDSVELKTIEQATKGPIIDALNEVVTRYQESNRHKIGVLRRVLLALMALMLATLAAEALFIFRPLFRRLAQNQRDLLKVASTDYLTGCMNRRFFVDAATREFERFKRYRTPLTLLVVDLDHFKSINDTYGHAVGDEAISQFARLAAGSLRTTDILARIGGEEFAILLPETTIEEAVSVAEKLRVLVAATPVPIPEGEGHQMTISIGVTALEHDDEGIFTALKRSDQSLYLAKNRGRNRVVGMDRAGETVLA